MKNRVVGASVGLQGASAGLYGGQGASAGVVILFSIWLPRLERL